MLLFQSQRPRSLQENQPIIKQVVSVHVQLVHVHVHVCHVPVLVQAEELELEEDKN